MALDSSRLVPAFTPSMLNSYERCPRQYFRKYVEKAKDEESFSPSLACGNAAHSALAGIFEQYRRKGQFPTNLRERVANQLPRRPYPDETTWHADVDKVVAWVDWATRSFDTTARIMLVERWLEYQFPGNAECPSFRLRHCVDLVVERPDKAIEHIDWKSGQRYNIDDLQNVVARIVTRNAYPSSPRILSSTAFLINAVIRTDDITRDQVMIIWDRIKDLVRSILAETEWPAASNALCPWCPLYQNGCPVYPTPTQSDSLTDWLEGVA